MLFRAFASSACSLLSPSGKKSLPLFLILVFTDTVLHAQLPYFNWAHAPGGTGIDETMAVAITPQGETVITGFFRNTFTMDPPVGNEILSSSGGDDIFVAKLDSNGTVLWAHDFGKTSEDRGESITCDAAGNIYVTGHFKGSSVDFDPGPVVVNLSSPQGGSLPGIFVLKLNPAGALIWARAFGGELAHSIDVDADGSVYIAGDFSDGANDFDPGSGTAITGDNGFTDFFLVKLNAAGNYEWHYALGGQLYDEGRTVKMDGRGHVVLTGSFTGSIDFDPGPDTTLLSPGASGQDGFITLLDTAGNLIWVKQFDCLSALQAWDMDVDAGGNIISTGVLYDDADMDPGPGTFMLTVPSAYYITYVVSLDSAGLFNWAGKITCTGYTRAHGLRADAAGNVYLTGWFSGTADLDPALATTQNRPYHGVMDSYLLKLNSAGQFLWAHTWGGSQGCSVNGLEVSLDGQQQWIAGRHGGSVDVNPNAGVYTLTGHGAFDLLTLKFGPQCVPALSTLTAEGCESWLSPSGAHLWTTTGVYTDTLVSAEGCDSILTIDLSISHAETGISENAGILTSHDSSATWQWIDCNNGFAPIPGATQQSFAPTAVGNYAVIVTEGSCMDTSACVQVSIISRSNSFPLPNLRIYPNPSEGEFVLDGNWEGGAARVTVCNAISETLWAQTWPGPDALPVRLSLPAGIYVVKVLMNDGRVWAQRMVIR